MCCKQWSSSTSVFRWSPAVCIIILLPPMCSFAGCQSNLPNTKIVDYCLSKSVSDEAIVSWPALIYALEALPGTCLQLTMQVSFAGALLDRLARGERKPVTSELQPLADIPSAPKTRELDLEDKQVEQHHSTHMPHAHALPDSTSCCTLVNEFMVLSAHPAYTAHPANPAYTAYPAYAACNEHTNPCRSQRACCKDQTELLQQQLQCLRRQYQTINHFFKGLSWPQHLNLTTESYTSSEASCFCRRLPWS